MKNLNNHYLGYNVDHWLGQLPNLHRYFPLNHYLIILTMPQASTRLSWMGQHTHRIQAGEPSPSNPDGRRQLARRTARARGETPFEFNQYNHKVWGGLDAEFVNI